MFIISSKSFILRHAPPIRPPSILGLLRSSSALLGFKLPPYNIILFLTPYSSAISLFAKAMPDGYYNAKNNECKVGFKIIIRHIQLLIDQKKKKKLPTINKKKTNYPIKH